MKTNNPMNILVQIHDWNKWVRGWLDIGKAQNKAFLTWAHFAEVGDKKQAKFYHKKYLSLTEIEKNYPKWEEKWEWDDD